MSARYKLSFLLIFSLISALTVTTEATICAQRFWYTPTGYCYCEYGGIRCYTNYAPQRPQPPVANSW
uniref:Uncharacterized protein n=1 Tax=Rhodnius prolixus TaxID=13249 RepID=T1HM02_RHOPR